MRKAPKAHLTGAALLAVLLVLAIQVYLFETVLGAVLDGQRGLLPGAFGVSLVLSGVALFLAFMAPDLDRE